MVNTKTNTNSQYILEVKDLTKIYKGSKAGVRNLTFNVKKGEIHAFIGENGSGKTTTIKTIINAYTGFSGKILIDGFDSKIPESKDKLGYVPEAAIFPVELTTFDYLYSLGRLSKLSKEQTISKIDELLKKMGILDLKNKKPAFFSSGQKKKVLLIQALMHNPELIILDEPTANLDPSARHEFYEILKSLHNEGKTIFLCSHILKEIDSYCDSLTLIHRGDLVYSGEKYDELEKIYTNHVLNVAKQKENSIQEVDVNK